VIAILAAEGPNGAWLPADIREFAWSAGAFAIVMLVLIRKVFPLAIKGLSDRSDGIRNELVEAERARVDAEAELSALRSKLGSAEAEQERITSVGRETAESVKADLMARADADAAESKDKAAAELSASAGQAAADIQAAAAAQAAVATESVVMANLDDGTHASLIDRYIEQVSAS